MKALITGAHGFIGSHLAKGIHERFANRVEVFACTRETSDGDLERMCEESSFVFHLAGVMRPEHPESFEENASGTDRVLRMLEQVDNQCPVLLASSTQATLDNPYGESKRQAEQSLIKHAERTGASVFIFRLPGVFGAGGRPFYNSVVATWCHCAARGEDIVVNGRSTLVTLAYVDDVVDEFCRTMISGPTASDGFFCQLPISYTVCLGYLADLVLGLADGGLQEGPECGAFEDKLYATFASYAQASGIKKQRSNTKVSCQ